MSAIINKLDSIADNLETKGLLKEAHDLDVISNTIEASSKRTAGLTAGQIEEIRNAVVSILSKKGIPEQSLAEKSPKELGVNKGAFMKELKALFPWVNFGIASAAFEYGPDLLSEVSEEELSHKPDFLGKNVEDLKGNRTT